MIFLYHVICDNCGSNTLLKLGYGIENKGFHYYCKNCNQEICVDIYEEFAGQSGSIQFKGGKQTSDPNYSNIVYHHPDFPIESNGDLVLSPFILAAQRYGNTFDERISRKIFYLNIVTEQKRDFHRVITNFLQKDWGNFEKSIIPFISKYSDDGSDLKRLYTISCIVEGINNKLFQSNYNSNIRKKITEKITYLQRQNPKELSNCFNDLMHEILPQNTLTIAQSFKKFYDYSIIFNQILVEWDPNNPDKLDFPYALNHPRDSSIIEFYKDLYELLAKNLTVLICFFNIEKRGNFLSFPTNPITKKKYAKNLPEFIQNPNAIKFILLKEEPFFYDWINPPINKDLRNAIGHNSLEYDEVNKIIKYHKKGGKNESLSYEIFILMIIGLIYRLYQFNSLNKDIYSIILHTKP